MEEDEEAASKRGGEGRGRGREERGGEEVGLKGGEERERNDGEWRGRD